MIRSSVPALEDIYTHPETHIPWYVVLGNHEHKGNGHSSTTPASAPAGGCSDFYTAVSNGEPDEVTADLFLIDTPRSISIGTTGEYPQSIKISREEQLAWLDSALREYRRLQNRPRTSPGLCRYLQGRGGAEDMKYILPILKKHNVDLTQWSHPQLPGDPQTGRTDPLCHQLHHLQDP